MTIYFTSYRSSFPEVREPGTHKGLRKAAIVPTTSRKLLESLGPHHGAYSWKFQYIPISWANVLCVFF